MVLCYVRAHLVGIVLQHGDPDLGILAHVGQPKEGVEHPRAVLLLDGRK